MNIAYLKYFQTQFKIAYHQILQSKVCLAQGVTVHTSHKLLVFDQPNVFLILIDS